MLDFEKIAERCADAGDAFMSKGFNRDEAILLVRKMLPDIMYGIEKEEWDMGKAILKPINPVTKRVWDNIYCAIPNAFAVAGMLGNLYFESEMDPKAAFGMKKYTEGVDSLKISMKKFVFDGVPYGLGQWKDWTRKQSLFNMARKADVSIGNLDIQTSFILDELNGVTYGPVMEAMKNAKSVEEVTHFIAVKYLEHEHVSPEDLAKIMDYARLFYNTYGVSSHTVSSN